MIRPSFVRDHSRPFRSAFVETSRWISSGTSLRVVSYYVMVFSYWRYFVLGVCSRGRFSLGFFPDIQQGHCFIGFWKIELYASNSKLFMVKSISLNLFDQIQPQTIIFKNKKLFLPWKKVLHIESLGSLTKLFLSLKSCPSVKVLGVFVKNLVHSWTRRLYTILQGLAKSFIRRSYEYEN